MKYMNLQLFATGDNNNQSARSYAPEFKELMQAVFEEQSYFDDFFAGGLEARDGITQKDDVFKVKTSDVACVIKTGAVGTTGAAYDNGAAVAFGEGTGKTSRFGERTEVIYTDIDAKYSWDWVMHEGIDRHTVNNDFDGAVADRLDLQAEEKVGMFNEKHAAFISSVAGHTITAESDVKDTFNALHAYFINAKVKKNITLHAKVTSDVYAAIVDSGLMTSAKGGTVSEDDQKVGKFKGFIVEEIPEDLFAEGECVYAYAENVAKAFTGIETARTIESEDFDGVALQGAGKAGEWILPDNKKAVVKVVVGGATGATGATGA
jgi:hypothetical protein